MNRNNGYKASRSRGTARFNRFRNERGHVFQGRYTSILIGSDRPLLGFVDYIHLNPVKAGICEVSALKHYELSSYLKYLKKTVRAGFCQKGFLSALRQLASVVGMRRYTAHLALVEEADPTRRDARRKRYCRGWFIGDKQEKEALEEDLREKHPEVGGKGSDLKELNEAMERGDVGRGG